MNNNFLAAFKYLILAFAAFIVPKMIVDSGRIVAPLEPNGATSDDSNRKKGGDFWPFTLSEKDDVPSATTPQSVSTLPGVRSRGSSGRPPLSNRPPNEIDGTFGTYNSAFGGEKYGSSANDVRANVPFLTGKSAVRSFSSDNFANDVSDAATDSSLFLPAESAAFFPTQRKTLDEIFRFEHSPNWFVDNWGRVDATPSVDGLLGYRVVVSTGSDVDDLTGVLTCYFDATSERRITFSGQTGDYRKTLRFLEREYGVALSPDSTASRLQYESTLTTTAQYGAQPSRFVVRPTRVFLRRAEKSFFNVDVVLERPYN